MEKEPEYYGLARYVNEGPAPADNFQYLEDLAYDDVFLRGVRASQRGDSPLEDAANRAMTKRYLNLVDLWIEEVDKREPDLGYEVYLEGLREIVRLGVNNHPSELLAVWPNLKKRADVLLANSRLTPSFARTNYHYDSEIVDALKEQLEMIRHG